MIAKQFDGAEKGYGLPQTGGTSPLSANYPIPSSGCISGMRMVADRPSLETYMKSLSMELDGLAAATTAIHDRLGIVLMPQAPAPDNKRPERLEPPSELCRAVEHFAFRIRDQREGLESILDRLTL